MITVPYAYTRRFFVEDETLISSCNSCFLPVAESSDEAELEVLEQTHSCMHNAEGFETRDEECELLLAV